MSQLIPRGVVVYPPEIASRRERVKEVITSVFRRWGFRQVITPLFEYYDDVFQNLDRSLKGGIVKLVERETGRLIVLRPDFTPQIARIAATLMKEHPRPLRLYYYGSVFRWPANGVTKEKELWQVGLELIGLDKPEAGAEMIAISKEVLDALNIEDYRISISNVGFLREVLSPFEEADRKRIAFALARKDRKELKELISAYNLEDRRRELLFSLMDFIGGEEILDEIRRIFVTPEMERHLTDLEEVISVLKNYGLYSNIIIDLSEIRGMAYHTGVFFEVFGRGIGKRLAVGGRYDELMQVYGSPEPAMGFAVDLDAMYRAVEASGRLPEEERVDFLVIDLSEVKRKGLEVAKVLRNKGYAVARDIIERSLDESIEYARKVGIRKVIVITDELKALGKLKLIELENNRDIIVDEERFLHFEKV
ncbi:MAG: ATP phosphoribosyltransferase regulatory subunit [Deferribacteres bacterium]|nr:ATP phosphoribosyltransferase regulatory subunit [Deferribacteres bacterium]